MMAKKKRYTEKQLKVLELVAKHPEWSNNQIGTEMVRLGYTTDRGYLNKLLWKERKREEDPEGLRKMISEPWRRMMLKEHGNDPSIWNRYHKDEDET